MGLCIEQLLWILQMQVNQTQALLTGSSGEDPQLSNHVALRVATEDWGLQAKSTEVI